MADSPTDSAQSPKANVDLAYSASLAGDELFKRGMFPQALERYVYAAQLSPDIAIFSFNAGLVCWRLGNVDEAQQHIERAIVLDPRVGRFHRILSQLHYDSGRIEAALHHARHALELAPNDPEITVALASMLEANGQPQEALQVIQPLINRGPHTNSLTMVLARLAPHLGMEQQAITLIQRVLESQAGQQSREIAALHLMLASLLDSQKQYDQAFMHARQGNSMRGLTYDRRKHERFIDELIGVMTRQRLSSLPHARNEDDRSVLIVGMPRSGTTLIEQIVASHPSVHGAGELLGLFRIWQSNFSQPGHLSETLAALSDQRVNELAQQYLEPLKALNPTALRIIDKMPSNFLYLGLVSLLLPKARIIHCRRDPVDTCLSCFMTDFVSANEFACDLGWLGHYYRQYERLMAHWKLVLDLPMLELQYEEVVADLPAQSHRLIEFLGLPWDDRCVQFHKTDRFVATASSSQVRKPLYRSSLKRWEHYRQHLSPLLCELATN